MPGQLHVAYHPHQPGGYLKIEVVRGDLREMVTSYWNRAEGEAYAGRLANLLSCAAIAADPCAECLAHHAQQEARQPAKKAPRPDEPPTAPPEVEKRPQRPASVVASPDEAPAC